MTEIDEFICLFKSVHEIYATIPIFIAGVFIIGLKKKVFKSNTGKRNVMTPWQLFYCMVPLDSLQSQERP